MKPTAFRNVVAVLSLLASALSLDAQEPARGELPNLDHRREAAAKTVTVTTEQGAAAESLKRRIPGLRIDWDGLLASPRFIVNEQGFLTGPDSEDEILTPRLLAAPAANGNEPKDPNGRIKRFLDENAALFGHGSEVLAAARVSREFVTPHNSLRTVVWEQQLDGISVFEAVLHGHITKNGELVSLCSQFLPDVAQAADAGTPNHRFVQAFPPVSAEQAVANAATNIGERLDSTEVTAEDVMPDGEDHRQQFKAGVLKGAATASLVWLPMSRATMRLCWRVVLTGKTRGETFQVLVDAQTGDPQVRHCWTSYADPVVYRVFGSDSPSPFSPGWSTPSTNQPVIASRVLTNLAAISTIASPDGWIGAGRSNTIGNNIDARLDLLDENVGYALGVNPPRPTGTTNSGMLTFDFALNLSQDPSTTDNRKSAQVNAFYWANWMHDKLYDLGFIEAAGNFQQTNFGRGGVGGDPVLVDVQDASGISLDTTNFNQSRFSTSLEGAPGRLQLRLFQQHECPSLEECGVIVGYRDTALDAETILHEYAHGLTTRLVGGGTGISALQTIGLGEGWSDFYALALLSEASDDLPANYAWGAYSIFNFDPNFANGEDINRTNYYFGARRYPYSTATNKCPLTFIDIFTNRSGTVHAQIPVEAYWNTASPWETHTQGQVWGVMLWEARARLIQKHGFELGSQLILQLVTDGLKLCPPNPNFVQARDALLLADRVMTGGANVAELWAAFAKRGLEGAIG